MIGDPEKPGPGDKPSTMRPPAPTSPATEKSAKAEPPAAPVSRRAGEPPAASEEVYVKPKKGPVRRFVRSLVSHLVFALLMVAAAFAWVYHAQIFNRLGDELCTADRLGGYMTKAQTSPRSPALATAPPVDIAKAPPSAPVQSPPPAAANAPAVSVADSAPSHPAAPSAPASEVGAALQPAPVASAGPSAAGPTPPTPSDATPKNAPALVGPAQTALSHPPAKAEPVATPAAAPPAAVKATGEPAGAAASAPTPATATTPAPDSRASAQTATPHPAQEVRPAQAETAREAAVPDTSKAVSAPGSERVAAAAPDPRPEPTREELNALMAEWQAARQLFASSKDQALDAYGKLVAKHPRLVALRGELGNVLYSMGRMKEAAEQYYEAALLHLDGPEPALAACLSEVIQGIDPDRARSLAPLMAGKSCPFRRGSQ